MSAFSTREVNPLDLILDTKNPRFIIPKEYATEKDIIKYLLNEENIEELCKGLNAVGTILPGERIVICDEDNKQVVLEGNRRICCCKLLLDRKLIPEGYKIPIITKETFENIKKISVDVVATRKIAMKYLAARHISGVDKWSTLAKMNYVNREFEVGRSVSEIREMSSLTNASINSFLRKGNLLRIGIENGKWSESEKEILALDKLKPDPYFRVLGVKGTRDLQIRYDDKFIPHSDYIVDKDLYDILTILVKGAFIDKAYNTRTDYFSEKVQNLIMPILGKYKISDYESVDNSNVTKESKNDENVTSSEPNPLSVQNGNEEHSSGASYKNDHSQGNEQGEKTHHDEVVKPSKNLPLFATLLCRVDNTKQEYRGLISICDEIVRFSTHQGSKNFPISAVLLTRCLIENTFVCYAKKFGKWDQLVKDARGPEKVKLGKIISCFVGNKNKIFDDATVRDHFEDLFGNKFGPVNKMNWVVHQLEAYKMPITELQNIIDEGLLKVIQYMIDQL
ncbi:MAG TPA: hypothetical protein DC024_01670 [Clostridiales bacterium]|jgi:hypothetical protein|nr:hypothetical protein [Clostridiales bacterium]